MQTLSEDGTPVLIMPAHSRWLADNTLFRDSVHLSDTGQNAIVPVVAAVKNSAFAR